MSQQLNLGNGFGRGALAFVIFEPGGKFAFKIFKSSKHPNHRDDPPSDDLIRAYFQAEHDAYQIVSKNPALAKHAPIFYGTTKIISVANEAGVLVSDHFLLDCCLQFERLSGHDDKLALYESKFQYLQQFTSQLKAAGISHTLDASVFNPGNAEGFKIIDFATRDVGAMCA